MKPRLKTWLGVAALIVLSWLLAAPAQAACTGGTCFWVGGTGTWDTTNTGGGGTGGIKWATTTGGTTGAGVPGSADNVTFDANSCLATCTITVLGGGAGQLITVASLTCGALTNTATLTFATNNNSLTVTGAAGFTCSGTGTRTLSLGSGTFTVSGTSAAWAMTTTTNLTFNAGTSTIQMTGTGQQFNGGGLTYNNVTYSGSSGLSIAGNNTFNTLTFNPGTTLYAGTTTTQTVTTLNLTGTSGSNIAMSSNSPSAPPVMNNAGAAQTLNWVAIGPWTFGGAGAWTANNSLKGGGVTGITVNPPAGGGSVGIIGG